jgi:hypothetical protein
MRHQSPPARGRGLKLWLVLLSVGHVQVAPRALVFSDNYNCRLVTVGLCLLDFIPSPAVISCDYSVTY